MLGAEPTPSAVMQWFAGGTNGSVAQPRLASAYSVVNVTAGGRAYGIVRDAAGVIIYNRDKPMSLACPRTLA